MSKDSPAAPGRNDSLLRFFLIVSGLLFGVGLAKVGNPVVLERVIDPPKNAFEFFTQSWPPSWGFVMLAPVLLLGALVARFKTASPGWLVWLPLVWLGWQLLAATHTVDVWLTHMALKQFTACVFCYYLGLLGLARAADLKWFWVPVLLGFLTILSTGLDQHYGGLESMRNYMYTYMGPDWQKTANPEFVKRINSNRVFSSLVYPNAFAGVILMLLPVLLSVVWQLTSRLQRMARMVLAGLFLYASLACLVWTGSKSGWLIALVMVLVVLLHQPFQKTMKLAVVGVVVVIGLAGFFYKYRTYFQKGATSVSARFDYWHAALGTAVKHPVLGSGPGTFSVVYKVVKAPEAEMAQLAHNDYLEQACDSGWVGFVAYAGWIIGALWLAYRRGRVTADPQQFCIWLGLLGWALQGVVEFGLYIPAVAWPFFVLLGRLSANVRGGRNEIDKAAPAV